MKRDPQTGITDVGFWSEIKLEIIKRYADAYAKVVNTKLTTVYIDAFAGAGVHESRQTKELIPGSPLNALNVEPQFDFYHFIDIDCVKLQTLSQHASQRANVTIHEGDCNELVPGIIEREVRYEQYRRALCIIDPYGVDFNWALPFTAGQAGTVDLFINFPTMDINRNVLLHDTDSVKQSDKDEMTRFWGDDSWSLIAYSKDRDRTGQLLMFGEADNKVVNKDGFVSAYCERLRSVAGFKFVPPPLAMKNSTNAVLYYLVFASHNPIGDRVARSIFQKFRR